LKRELEEEKKLREKKKGLKGKEIFIL